MVVALEYKDAFTAAEYNMFLREAASWKAAHPDWTAKEDVDDIMAISVEKVTQGRLLRQKKLKRILNIEDDYNASVKRVQEHRKNLLARRADRMAPGAGKSSGNTYNYNIAVLAGNHDAALEDSRRRSMTLAEEEDRAFPLLGEGKDVAEAVEAEVSLIDTDNMPRLI
jgi:anaerobic selenocysteine-containing dehydrogenase